ncbi:hypothetical protein K7H20_21935 [Salipiger manganoxidans]|uniref:hypothetical protein n=1 Tax=Salipiger marinus TaxID=555512 RepID=UPI0013F4FA1A|nr:MULTISPECIES: hypothetical protein [Salipiger]MCD1620725.1 hypothetical protein [Salipiger manganoxidans]
MADSAAGASRSATLPFVTFDKATGLLAIDVTAALISLAVVLYFLVSGGIFEWFR